MQKNEPINICIVAKHFLSTGKVWILRHVRETAIGNKVVVFCLKRVDGAQDTSGIPVYALKLGDFILRPINFAVRILFKREWVGYELYMKLFFKIRRPDIIHIHFFWNAIWFFDFIKKINIPIIVTGHGSDVNGALEDPGYRKNLLSILPYLSRVVVISEFLKRQLLEIGCPENKIVVNYLGVPLRDIPLKESTPQEIKLVCVAFLREEKGHSFLLEAFRGVVTHPSMKDYKVTLRLIGDGPLEDELVSQAETLGIKDKIIFMGSMPQDEVFHWLGQSDIYVQHSIVFRIEGDQRKEEGLSIGLCEAAMMGLPLVSSNVGGCGEICRDNQNGILFNPGDVNAMTKAIVLLATDLELRSRMAETGRRIIEKDFESSKQNDKLSELYREIISS